jgi:hypothetical protein
MIELTYYAVSLSAVLYLVVAVVRKTRRSKRRKKIDLVIDSIHTSGKVMYKGKAFTVKEICDSSHFEGKEYKIDKNIVVVKPGGEQLFKLSIDDVEPYSGK